MRDRNPLRIAFPAAVLIVIALGLIRTKLVDIPLVLPVPAIVVAKGGWTRLLQASIIASSMILAAKLRPFSFRQVSHPQEGLKALTGEEFGAMILLLDIVATQVKYLYVNPTPVLTYLFFGVFCAAVLCRISDGALAGIYSQKAFAREWARLHPGDLAGPVPVKYRHFYLFSVIRILTLAAIWSLVITQLWI
jgi:hypothetical protein